MNHEIAREVYLKLIAEDTIREVLATEVVGPSLVQASREQKENFFKRYVEHMQHELLLNKARQNFVTLVTGTEAAQ